MSKCASVIETEGTTTQEVASTNVGPFSSDDPPPKRKGSQAASRDDQMLSVLTSALQAREAREKQADSDEDRLFLLSLLPELKKIPDSEKLSTKMDIMKVIQQKQNNSVPPFIMPSFAGYQAPPIGHYQGRNASYAPHITSLSTSQQYDGSPRPAQARHLFAPLHVDVPQTTVFSDMPSADIVTVPPKPLDDSGSYNDRPVSVNSSVSSASGSGCESQLFELYP